MGRAGGCVPRRTNRSRTAARGARRSGVDRGRPRGRPTDPAAGAARPDHLPRQGQGRGTPRGRRAPRRRHRDLRQRPFAGANPQPRTGPGSEGARSLGGDPRHLRGPGADLRSPPRRGTRAARILPAPTEADVDPSLAAQDGDRHARPGREAARGGPPARREADPRPQDRTRRDPRPPRAAGGIPSRPHDRLARRLHQRRQEHSAQRPDRRRRTGRGQTLRHARYANPPLAAARLGAGAPQRHRRLPPRPASQADRELQGHARGDSPGRPASPCGRRLEPIGRRPDRRCPWRARGTRRGREGHAPGAQQGRCGARSRDPRSDPCPLSPRARNLGPLGCWPRRTCPGGERRPGPRIPRRRRGDRSW